MTALVKRSMQLHRMNTSVALEPEFWEEVERHAKMVRKSVSAVVSEVDAKRGDHTLASALRVAALGWARELIA